MDRPKVLKRTITPEIRASRERDMETVLDNYRENLRDHGVTDDLFLKNTVRCRKNMKALITATVLQTSITPQLTGKVLLLK